MQRLSGRLREVVAYKNRTTGSLFGEEVWAHLPGGYSHTLPIQVCATQRGRDFEAPDLERGIHFRGIFYNGV